MKRRFVLPLLVLSAFSTSFSAVRAADAKPYPLTTCIVSDNKLGSMGKIISLVHEGQEVKFCCKPCVKKFNANPAKFLGKLPR